MFEKDAKLTPQLEKQLVQALSNLLPGVDKDVIRSTLREYENMGLDEKSFPLHMQALIAKIRSKRS